MKCISQQTFSEDVIKEEFRQKLSQPSFNEMNPNSFSTNTNIFTNFLNQPLPTLSNSTNFFNQTSQNTNNVK